VPRSSTSPVASVQAMQALIARELVTGFGLPERQAASLLGLAPSAVSQYLSGKRLGPTIGAYLGDERARRLAREAAQELVTAPGGGGAVLEAAIALADLHRPGAGRSSHRGSRGMSARLRAGYPGWLRHRVTGEQNAVAECMRLAQRSRDELTRAVFRQIASDSLRHAEIVASIASYLDRGIVASVPSGISREEIETLIAREREAEAAAEGNLGEELGGVMRILWQSIEADERKHDLLLQELLRVDLRPGSGAAPAGSAARGSASDPRPNPDASTRGSRRP